MWLVGLMVGWFCGMSVTLQHKMAKERTARKALTYLSWPGEGWKWFECLIALWMVTTLTSPPQLPRGNLSTLRFEICIHYYTLIIYHWGEKKEQSVGFMALPQQKCIKSTSVFEKWKVKWGQLGYMGWMWIPSLIIVTLSSKACPVL